MNNNKRIAGGMLAAFAGFLLAAGTAFSVVNSQESAGSQDTSGPVSYGVNN